ncbi:MAG: DEAD/DEAH box helicase [Fibrobacteraceae bacterium]|nr:DEAD/DEAH box helicase [Fibrobacteraceae bacterium]
MSKIISPFKINYDAKHNAFPYQTQALNAIKDFPYAAIFHEQGLGKTKIAIDLLLYWLQKRDIDTVLIVTKKQLVANWLGEFAEHTFIHPKVLNTSKKDNFYVLNSPAKVVITNFETLSTDKVRISLFLKSRNVAIIIDESTKIKNPDSKLTKDFFDLRGLFKIRVIMTGTPVANRPYDIWSQIFFLDGGASLGSSFKEFKSNTDLANNLSQDNGARKDFENAVAQIWPKISGFSIRETKKTSGIVLPQKNYESIYVDFEPDQRKIYNKIVEEMFLEVSRNGNVYFDDESAILKRLLRLLQVTSSPTLVDDRYSKSSAKDNALEKLIQTIIGRNEKCIVWSSFIENVNRFAKKYSCYNPRKIHGSMSIDERTKSVDLFKNEPECKVLFATPQAAKEGLTLTVANNVIFYDRGFNLDDYLQAQDRIHRISQKKECFIYNLIVKDSVDEWIDVLLEAKQRAAFLAQGDITSQQYAKIADYGYGDIIRKILQENKELEND